MRHLEAVVWQLIEEPHVHLLNPCYDSYQALLLDAIAHAVERVRTAHPESLSERAFSEFSHKPVVHPLTRAVPILGPYLNKPDVPLRGDAFIPRVGGLFSHARWPERPPAIGLLPQRSLGLG